jgi:hypothetical protein
MTPALLYLYFSLSFRKPISGCASICKNAWINIKVASYFPWLPGFSGGAPDDLLEEELQIIGIHEWRYTMPKIHDPPLLASAEPLHHILYHPRDRLPPTVQDPRVRISLQRDPPSGNPDCLGRVMQPIQPHDIVPGLTQLVQRIPRALCKNRHRHDVDLQLLEPLRQLLGNMLQIRQRKVREAGGRELASPAVEDHDELRARDDLAREILDAELRDDLEQLLGLVRVPVQPRLGLAEDLGPAALDHVAEEGPGRAAEADERDAAAQFFARQRDGLVDVVELFFDVVLVRGQVVVLGVGGRGERVREGGAFFGQHLHRHAHGLRDDEDVAEDDGGVDEVGVAVDRLEGQGRRDFRGAAAGEEVVRAFGVVVFGEVAACLSHNPYWWSVDFLASSGSQ